MFDQTSLKQEHKACVKRSQSKFDGHVQYFAIFEETGDLKEISKCYGEKIIFQYYKLWMLNQRLTGHGLLRRFPFSRMGTRFADGSKAHLQRKNYYCGIFLFKVDHFESVPKCYKTPHLNYFTFHWKYFTICVKEWNYSLSFCCLMVAYTKWTGVLDEKKLPSGIRHWAGTCNIWTQFLALS